MKRMDEKRALDTIAWNSMSQANRDAYMALDLLEGINDSMEKAERERKAVRRCRIITEQSAKYGCGVNFKNKCTQCGDDSSGKLLLFRPIINATDKGMKTEYICEECLKKKIAKIKNDYDISNVFYWQQNEQAMDEIRSIQDSVQISYNNYGSRFGNVKPPVKKFFVSGRNDLEYTSSDYIVIAGYKYEGFLDRHDEYCLLTPKMIYIYEAQGKLFSWDIDINVHTIKYNQIESVGYDNDGIVFYLREGNIKFTASKISLDDRDKFCRLIIELRNIYFDEIDNFGEGSGLKIRCPNCHGIIPMHTIDEVDSSYEYESKVVIESQIFGTVYKLCCSNCFEQHNDNSKVIGLIRKAFNKPISRSEWKSIPLGVLEYHSVGLDSANKVKCNYCRNESSAFYAGEYNDTGYIICEKCYNKLKRITEQAVHGTGKDVIDLDLLIEELAVGYNISRLYYPKGNNAKEDENSSEKIGNASKEYGKTIGRNEKVIACFDDTYFGSASDGCLLTNRGIYIHNSGDNGATYISYKKLRSLDVKEKKIQINDCYLDAGFMLDDKYRFCNLLWDLKETFSTNEDDDSYEDSTLVSADPEMQDNENNLNDAESLNDGTGTMDGNSLVAKAGVGVIGLNSAVEHKLETKEASAITQSEKTQQTVKLNCKKTLDNSKVFRLQAGMTIADIGRVVEAFLRNDKKLLVEGIESRDGYFVQAREASTWKKLTGLGKTLQVQIVPSGTEDVTVNIGAGQWADKVGAAAVGAIVFAPLLVTSAVGAYLQNKLPDEIFDVIERYIMSGGHSARRNVTLERADPSQTKCPSCGAMNPKSTKFCSGCGAKLAASCPSCGKDVEHGKNFCPHCGSPMVMEKTNACPSCGAAVPEGKKFCSECGASMENLNKNQCPSCKAMVDKDLRFCPECGSPMSDKKVCKKCGAELAEGQKFCGKCGAKME